jgi:uncharacterized Zn finger protein
MDKQLAEPKCPGCSVVGLNQIVSQKSVQHSKGGDAWFEVAHCASCGHIYGVFPKVVLGPSMPIPSFPIGR